MARPAGTAAGGAHDGSPGPRQSRASGGAPGNRSTTVRYAALALGVLLAVGASLAAFLTEDPLYLRLAVLGVAWAFVIAFLAAGGRRADQVLAAGREKDLRHAYDLELEREVAARREHELRLENQLRREAQDAMRGEVEAMRRDLAALAQLRGELQGLTAMRADMSAEMGLLRRELTEQLSGELLVERIVMRTQSIRMPVDRTSPAGAIEGTAVREAQPDAEGQAGLGSGDEERPAPLPHDSGWAVPEAPSGWSADPELLDELLPTSGLPPVPPSPPREVPPWADEHDAVVQDAADSHGGPDSYDGAAAFDGAVSDGAVSDDGAFPDDGAVPGESRTAFDGPVPDDEALPDAVPHDAGPWAAEPESTEPADALSEHRPGSVAEAAPAGHERLHQILAENGIRLDGGRRRRHERTDEAPGDDVLARVLGR